MTTEPQTCDALDSDLPRPPSKTELKRQSTAVLDLAGELIGLSVEQLETLALPSDLLSAVRLARSMKPDAAFKRQKKYIGKLLRQLDSEPVRVKLTEIRHPNHSATRLLHQIERWRDRLIAEGDHALGDLMADFPQADRSKLRQLIATAKTERERAQPPKSARLMFKYLRELMDTD